MIESSMGKMTRCQYFLIAGYLFAKTADDLTFLKIGEQRAFGSNPANTSDRLLSQMAWAKVWRWNQRDRPKAG